MQLKQLKDQLINVFSDTGHTFLGLIIRRIFKLFILIATVRRRKLGFNWCNNLITKQILIVCVSGQ